jgi:putative hydrolase of the HAD superfamily
MSQACEHHSSTRQHLIFDADDTLWENNVYFEHAFEQFCEYLAHSSMGPQQIRAVLDEIETANAKINGYGCRSFGRNLAACFQHLAERDISDRDLNAVSEFAQAILDRPLKLLAGVEATLAELAVRHELTLFTKGEADEQQFKIDRSGLARYLHYSAIVKEKNEPAYRELAQQRGFRVDKTWMIGNSPKSDINPALAAGLGAVYVPHPRTWTLEHEPVPDGHPRLLCLDRIQELTNYF